MAINTFDPSLKLGQRFIRLGPIAHFATGDTVRKRIAFCIHYTVYTVSRVLTWKTGMFVSQRWCGAAVVARFFKECPRFALSQVKWDASLSSRRLIVSEDQIDVCTAIGNWRTAEVAASTMFCPPLRAEVRRAFSHNGRGWSNKLFVTEKATQAPNGIATGIAFSGRYEHFSIIDDFTSVVRRAKLPAVLLHSTTAGFTVFESRSGSSKVSATIASHVPNVTAIQETLPSRGDGNYPFITSTSEKFRFELTQICSLFRRLHCSHKWPVVWHNGAVYERA